MFGQIMMLDEEHDESVEFLMTVYNAQEVTRIVLCKNLLTVSCATHISKKHCTLPPKHTSKQVAGGPSTAPERGARTKKA